MTWCAPIKYFQLQYFILIIPQQAPYVCAYCSRNLKYNIQPTFVNSENDTDSY